MERSPWGSVEQGNDGWSDDDHDSEDGSEDDEPEQGYRHMIDQVEETLDLKRVVEVDGTLIGENVDIEEWSNIMQKDVFCREPDEEEYVPHTGNEGTNATRWYRDTVLVILPNRNKMGFLLRPHKDEKGLGRKVRPWLESCVSKAKSTDASDFIKLCTFIIGTRRLKHCRDLAQDDIIGRAVTALIEIGQFCALASATRMAGQLPVGTMRVLARTLDDPAKQDVKEALNQAMLKYPSLDSTFDIFGDMFGQGFGKWHPVARPWVIEQVRLALLRAGPTVTETEGNALAHAAVSVDSVEFIQEHISPVVAKFAANGRFVLAFLSKWLNTARPVYSPATINAVFSDNIRGAMEKFTLTPCTPPPPPNQRTVGGAASTRTNSGSGSNSLAAMNLSRVLSAVLQPGATIELQEFCDLLVRESQRIDGSLIMEIMVPALRDVEILAIGGLQLPSGHCIKQLYAGVLTQLVLPHVGAEPPLSSWVKRQVEPCCDDCDELNRFLISTREVGKFKMGKDRREHLEYMLRKTHCHKAITRRPPYTLVVTKLDRVRTAYQAWADKRREAMQLLRQFPSPEGLGTLIDDPTTFKNMREMRFQPLSAAQTRDPLQTLAVNVQPPVIAGVKRKADDAPEPPASKRSEVINLCSDSE